MVAFCIHMSTVMSADSLMLRITDGSPFSPFMTKRRDHYVVSAEFLTAHSTVNDLVITSVDITSGRSFFLAYC